MRWKRELGTVRLWKDGKGYGFAVPDHPFGFGADVFIHTQQFLGDVPTLQPGDRVSYTVEISRTPDGSKAARGHQIKLEERP